jgi:hypothetical protein
MRTAGKTMTGRPIVANLGQVSKRGGLLPRISGGSVTTGERYGEWPDGQSHERGQMPPMLFTINIDGHGPDGVEYQAQLTEDEMLKTCAEWMSMLTSRRSRAAFDARNKAAKAASHAA